MAATAPRCKANRVDGEACGNRTTDPSGLCHVHAPRPRAAGASLASAPRSPGAEASLSRLAAFANEHRILVTGIAYGLLAFVGLSYEYRLLQPFGINYFDFATVSDFVLAGFKHPVALIVTSLLGVALVLLTWAVVNLLRYTAASEPPALSAVGKAPLRYTVTGLQHAIELIERHLSLPAHSAGPGSRASARETLEEIRDRFTAQARLLIGWATLPARGVLARARSHLERARRYRAEHLPLAPGPPGALPVWAQRVGLACIRLVSGLLGLLVVLAAPLLALYALIVLLPGVVALGIALCISLAMLLLALLILNPAIRLATWLRDGFVWLHARAPRLVVVGLVAVAMGFPMAVAHELMSQVAAQHCRELLGDRGAGDGEVRCDSQATAPRAGGDVPSHTGRPAELAWSALQRRGWWPEQPIRQHVVHRVRQGLERVWPDATAWPAPARMTVVDGRGGCRHGYVLLGSTTTHVFLYGSGPRRTAQDPEAGATQAAGNGNVAHGGRAASREPLLRILPRSQIAAMVLPASRFESLPGLLSASFEGPLPAHAYVPDAAGGDCIEGVWQPRQAQPSDPPPLPPTPRLDVVLDLGEELAKAVRDRLAGSTGAGSRMLLSQVERVVARVLEASRRLLASAGSLEHASSAPLTVAIADLEVLLDQVEARVGAGEPVELVTFELLDALDRATGSLVVPAPPGGEDVEASLNDRVRRLESLLVGLRDDVGSRGPGTLRGTRCEDARWLATVSFDTGAAEPVSTGPLDAIEHALRGSPEPTQGHGASAVQPFLLVEGFADSSGPVDLNLRLAEKRAEGIRKRLGHRLGNPFPIKVVTWGERFHTRTDDERDPDARVVTVTLCRPDAPGVLAQHSAAL